MHSPLFDKFRIFFARRIAIIIFLVLYVSVALAVYKDFGASFDEFMVYTRGDYFYHKVVGNDPYLQKGFVVRDTDNYVLHYYNSTYPALLYAINDSQSYETYHLLNILFGSIIFIALYETLLVTYKKWYYAILGPVLLLLVPRFLGHIPANPKDVPFATAYMATLFVILIRRSLSPFLRVLLLGFFIGITVSLRFVGFTLVIIYFVFMLFDIAQKKEMIKQVWEAILESIIISALSFAVLMTSLPYIGADPYNHTIELLKVNKNYPWLGTMRFFGKSYTKDSFPLLYTPLWILISTPVSILLLSTIGFVRSFFGKINKLQLLVLISLIVQSFFYFILKPFVYNGVRHYLFILPHLVLLVIIAIVSIKKYARLFKALVAFLIIDACFIIFMYIQLHPYEYTYFNPIVHLGYDVDRDFDFDYWAASDRKSLEWLKNNTIQAAPKIFMCSDSPSLQIYYPEAIDVNKSIHSSDYIICNDNGMLEKILKNSSAKIIYQEKKGNIIYNTVLKNNSTPSF